MSLYPSFDQIKIYDEITETQKSIESEKKPQATNDSVSVVPSSNNKSLYPVLSEYMGLDISDKSGQAVAIPETNNKLSKQNEDPQGLRRLTLCKDAKGKVGLLVSAINAGIFVRFVLKNSPAALGGLRFGDQILQINETQLAGFTSEKVHNLIRKCSVNNINLIVRNRPFERYVSMMKDSAGRVGFEYKNGKITALVKDSSASRNGLVTDHHLLEVQGRNIIGMDDKEISKIIQDAGQLVTVTIIPSFIYEQMMKKMRADYVKAKMDHKAHA